jgi:hypothetical protein
MAVREAEGGGGKGEEGGREGRVDGDVRQGLERRQGKRSTQWNGRTCVSYEGTHSIASTKTLNGEGRRSKSSPLLFTDRLHFCLFLWRIFDSSGELYGFSAAYLGRHAMLLL